MPGISEKPVSRDTLLSIKKCARSASKVLGIEPRSSTPSVVTAAVDQFVRRWQQGKRPAASLLSAEDAPLIIGSLWGEAIVSRFKWQWGMVTFHDHNDVVAPAVFSADRSLAIYPLHFLLGCFSDPAVDVTIMLAYNVLKANSIQKKRPGAFYNLMDGVHRIVRSV